MSDVELAKLQMLNRALEWLYNPRPLCCLCKCGVDPQGAHRIVNSDYAHVHCAEAQDSQDLGSLPDPGDLMGSERPDIENEE